MKGNHNLAEGLFAANRKKLQIAPVREMNYYFYSYKWVENSEKFPCREGLAYVVEDIGKPFGKTVEFTFKVDGKEKRMICEIHEKRQGAVDIMLLLPHFFYKDETPSLRLLNSRRKEAESFEDGDVFFFEMKGRGRALSFGNLRGGMRFEPFADGKANTISNPQFAGAGLLSCSANFLAGCDRYEDNLIATRPSETQGLPVMALVKKK